jgi:preprotein translocase subunit SecG
VIETGGWTRVTRPGGPSEEPTVYYALVVVHTLVCLAIIGIVLLQAGKGADIGSAFGGGGSQAVFGSMGTPTILGKITTGVAIVFMITSFSLAKLSSRPTSVVPATAPAPAAEAPAPGAPAAPPAVPK